MFALGGDVVMLEEVEDAGGGAGGDGGGVVLEEFAEVGGGEAVDVFLREDAVEDFGLGEVGGEGGLYEDAVDEGVGVEGVDLFKDGLFLDGGWEEEEVAFETDLGGNVLFFLDVGDGSGVVADADKSNRQWR